MVANCARPLLARSLRQRRTKLISYFMECCANPFTWNINSAAAGANAASCAAVATLGIKCTRLKAVEVFKNATRLCGYLLLVAAVHTPSAIKSLRNLKCQVFIASHYYMLMHFARHAVVCMRGAQKWFSSAKTDNAETTAANRMQKWKVVWKMQIYIVLASLIYWIHMYHSSSFWARPANAKGLIKHATCYKICRHSLLLHPFYTKSSYIVSK